MGSLLSKQKHRPPRHNPSPPPFAGGVRPGSSGRYTPAHDPRADYSYPPVPPPPQQQLQLQQPSRGKRRRGQIPGPPSYPLKLSCSACSRRGICFVAADIQESARNQYVYTDIPPGEGEAAEYVISVPLCGLLSKSDEVSDVLKRVLGDQLYDGPEGWKKGTPFRAEELVKRLRDRNVAVRGAFAKAR